MNDVQNWLLAKLSDCGIHSRGWL